MPEEIGDSRITVFLDELTMLYEICYACENHDTSYLRKLKARLKQLKSSYPYHQSIDMMQAMIEEWTDEAKEIEHESNTKKDVCCACSF